MSKRNNEKEVFITFTYNGQGSAVDIIRIDSAQFGKTHATIVHGVKTIEKRLDVEEDLRKSLNEILSELGYTPSDKMEF